MNKMVTPDEMASSLVDLVERVEKEHNLEPGTLMEAWVNEYNARIEAKKERKVYNN